MSCPGQSTGWWYDSTEAQQRCCLSTSDAREAWSSLPMTFCRELVTSEQADFWMLINMKVNYDRIILLSAK
jgi:hypothetical protein